MSNEPRSLCAQIYALEAATATYCEKSGCDRIGWVEVDILLTGGDERSMRLCEGHAGSFLAHMLPKFELPAEAQA